MTCWEIAEGAGFFNCPDGRNTIKITLLLLAAKAIILYLLLISIYLLLADTAMLIAGKKKEIMAIEWNTPAVLAVIFYLLNNIL